MTIKADPAALRKTTWQEYAIRFVAGGLVTVMAGLIAKKFGPGVGGLFLAFPAIFPAAATLIEKHEKEKKTKTGPEGAGAGRNAVALDAAGTAVGTLGLVTFAYLVWRFMPIYSPWIVLAGASLAWFLLSATLWYIRSKLARPFAG